MADTFKPFKVTGGSFTHTSGRLEIFDSPVLSIVDASKGSLDIIQKENLANVENY